MRTMSTEKAMDMELGMCGGKRTSPSSAALSGVTAPCDRRGIMAVEQARYIASGRDHRSLQVCSCSACSWHASEVNVQLCTVVRCSLIASIVAGSKLFLRGRRRGRSGVRRGVL